MTLAVARWYCSRCGIVRDTCEKDCEPVPPWCRHNAPETEAARMVTIPDWHPLATGMLPWGYEDPART